MLSANKADKKRFHADYLREMGITRWQRRFTFLVGINANEQTADKRLPAAKSDLLGRILTALHWNVLATKICFIPDSEEKPNPLSCFTDLLQRYQPTKILLVDLPALEGTFESKIESATLPSLEQLLIDKEAKRRAWHQIQKLQEPT